MLYIIRRVRNIVAAVSLTCAMLTIGCGAGVTVGYRAYDPYRSDYHVWDGNEGAFYTQWSIQTHRDPKRDYRKLGKDEQTEYWKWRHDQPDGK